LTALARLLLATLPGFLLTALLSALTGRLLLLAGLLLTATALLIFLTALVLIRVHDFSCLTP
jgi:hypothetical protein